MQFHLPSLDITKKLSAEEATELAARVADLAKAGLPLGEGLRAFAQELSSRRLTGMLFALADQLDAGVDLAEAVDSLGSQIPPHLRGLILAGLRGGHLSEVLEEYVDLERNQSELRHRLLMSFAYPVLLLTMLTGLAVFMHVYVVSYFVRIFMDFGMKLPDLTVVFIKCSPVIVFCMFILLAVFFTMPIWLAALPRVRWLGPILYRIPVVGPMLRWNRVARCSRLLGLLLEQQTPLPDALQLTSGGLRDAHLSHGCRLLADDMEHGGILYERMAARPRYFPASMVPIIEWGQRAPALPDAFRAAAEMFEGRIRREGSMLEAILLPVTFLMIIGYVGLFTIAMLLPLISLITVLSK
jgi:general secretion pathway protein F